MVADAAFQKRFSDERGSRADGEAAENHFSVGEVDSTKLAATIHRFAEADLKCIITELDIGIPSTSEKDLMEQARNYRVVTDIMLNNDNCPHIIIWGIKDNDSWRSASNPLLYTSGMGKKQAWYAVRSALRHRTLTTSVGETKSENLKNEKWEKMWFDLNGRPVGNNSLRHGLYLTNGRIILK